MNLFETLNHINTESDFDDLMTVYVKKPWDAGSDTIITPQPDDGSTAPIQEHYYFLEVFIIKDWLEELDSPVVSEETCNRIVQYAINDA